MYSFEVPTLVDNTTKRNKCTLQMNEESIAKKSIAQTAVHRTKRVLRNINEMTVKSTDERSRSHSVKMATVRASTLPSPVKYVQIDGLVSILAATKHPFIQSVNDNVKSSMV